MSDVNGLTGNIDIRSCIFDLTLAANRQTCDWLRNFADVGFIRIFRPEVVKPSWTHGITDKNVLRNPCFSNSRLNCIYFTVCDFICICTYEYFLLYGFLLEPINVLNPDFNVVVHTVTCGGSSGPLSRKSWRHRLDLVPSGAWSPADWWSQGALIEGIHSCGFLQVHCRVT